MSNAQILVQVRDVNVNTTKLGIPDFLTTLGMCGTSKYYKAGTTIRNMN